MKTLYLDDKIINKGTSEEIDYHVQFLLRYWDIRIDYDSEEIIFLETYDE